jgi:drug/metabolite transporter (DMT)-like permease
MLWGGNFVAVRVALDYLDPYLLTALRFAFVATVIPFVGWPTVPLSSLLFYATCSGIGQYMLSTVAIQLGLSPGLAALLMQFQVFISLALSWLLLKESVPVTTVIGSVLGVVGLTGVLLTGGTKAPWLASAVCLVAAAGWAAANMTVKRHPENVIRLQGASGLICLPIIWVAREFLSSAEPPITQILAQMPLTGWLSVAYVVIASFAVAQILWGFAIGINGVAATSPFALLIPLFGIVLAWLILGEHLSSQLISSATIVVIGVSAHIIPLALPNMFSRRIRRS